MSEQAFELVEQCLESAGSGAGIDFLVKKFREEKKYPQLFEARLMKKRYELGLPLIHNGPLNDLPEDKQRAYDEGSMEVAREVGRLFLAEGEIERAWPYFRAIGEAEPIREAIENLEVRDDLDGVIEIAYHERVNPRKGFELALKNYGTCRAITYFGQYPSEEGREDSARLLTRTLYDELAENLGRTIEKNEDKAPATSSVSELIESRDWLFEGNSYYIDTSHVGSIVQYAVEWTDRETLEMAVELCAYGKRLAPMFQYKGNRRSRRFSRIMKSTCGRCSVKTSTARSPTSRQRSSRVIRTKSVPRRLKRWSSCSLGWSDMAKPWTCFASTSARLIRRT